MIRVLLAASLTGILLGACGGATPPASAQGTAGAPPTSAIATQAASTDATIAPAPSMTTWKPALHVQADQPIGILLANGSIWVTEHHSGRLLRIDQTTGQIHATIAGVGDGAGQPFTAAGRIWVPSTDGLVAIDPKTDKLVLTVPGTFSPDGVFVAGRIWIGDRADSLLELDPATGHTTGTVPAPSLAALREDCVNGVTAGPAHVWWSINDAGTIELVDAAKASVAGATEDVGRSAAAVVSGTAWLDSNDGEIRELDPSSGRVTRIVRFMDAAPDNCAGSIVADGTSVWVVDDVDFSHLWRFDTSIGKVTAHIDPGDSDIQAITIANRSLWMTFYDSGMVDRFDLPGG